jgi:lipid A 4'-phosphatase
MGLVSAQLLSKSPAPPLRFWPYFLPVLALAVVIFTLFPQIDLWVSGFFYSGGRPRWPLADGANWARVALNVAAWAILGAAIAIALWTIVRSLLRREGWPTWSAAIHAAVFVGMCYALGPGLIVNGGFKSYWGRARPNAVVEFSGQKAFTPALQPTDQCPRNCSFVSGEGSLGYVSAAPAAVLSGVARVAALGTGGVIGTALGGVRVIQGAHFVSDVVFSGLASWFAIWLSYGLVYRQWLQELWRRRRRVVVAEVAKPS